MMPSPPQAARLHHSRIQHRKRIQPKCYSHRSRFYINLLLILQSVSFMRTHVITIASSFSWTAIVHRAIRSPNYRTVHFSPPISLSSPIFSSSIYSKKVTSLSISTSSSSSSSSSSTTTTTTTTRSRWNNVSEQDKTTIQNQLGYLPSNLLSVSARRGDLTKSNHHQQGTPVALRTYPLNGGATRRKTKAKGALTPFPTLYWFCCPEIGRAIADLERRGFVGILEDRFRWDEDHRDGNGNGNGKFHEAKGWRKQFVAAHEEYARERWETLVEEDALFLLSMDSSHGNENGDENQISNSNSNNNNNMDEGALQAENSKGMMGMIRYSGIAGTDFSTFRWDERAHVSIKCLHAHYAHYRSQCAAEAAAIQLLEEKGEGQTRERAWNIVGQWTHELLQQEFPDLVL